ncbi:PREDICTED: uncharacterized protein LOC108966944 [Bactrocera latifrons]|uniref:Uncharacterized protein n=1 Tax=Bactrocera latifrons TaxID=174628 RepID=A0A0K8VB46_BACLA|nr:PREDICTED: uncharacterized protein LOC108966944 [Bactrocera latifrons]XP_039960410.1 uncharacterized protein LOC120774725 [Bactrocera tryoni]XP_050329146.1 uncharacterized protein LOC126758804 [Bactrocera neohumeralis]
MRNLIYVFAAALLCLCATSVQGDLLDCNEKIIPSLSDLPIIGPKVSSAEESSEHQVRDFFKNVGCQIKKGAEKVSEQAKKIGTELKEGAKKFGEKAKDLGSDIKDKLGDIKDKFSKDSSEELTAHKLLNVELINPDILKAEQQCGHGHILDALGNCSKLRK